MICFAIEVLRVQDSRNLNAKKNVSASMFFFSCNLFYSNFCDHFPYEAKWVNNFNVLLQFFFALLSVFECSSDSYLCRDDFFFGFSGKVFKFVQTQF